VGQKQMQNNQDDKCNQNHYRLLLRHGWKTSALTSQDTTTPSTTIEFDENDEDKSYSLTQTNDNVSSDSKRTHRISDRNIIRAGLNARKARLYELHASFFLSHERYQVPSPCMGVLRSGIRNDQHQQAQPLMQQSSHHHLDTRKVSLSPSSSDKSVASSLSDSGRIHVNMTTNDQLRIRFELEVAGKALH
jgi:hypothetical protein